MPLNNQQSKIQKEIEDYLRNLQKLNLKNLTDNYLEDGYLDSLEFINFINHLEVKYSVIFTQENLQDDNLYNIKGLSEIILLKIFEKQKNE